jgi:murein DD-endopeptidase MepM/ murein hydrolase activator NlpD
LVFSSITIISACGVFPFNTGVDSLNVLGVNQGTQPPINQKANKLLFSSYPPRTATSSITPKPSSSNTSTPNPPTSTITATPSPTPQFVLCSPLAPHSIADLPNIISDPFRPPPPGKDFRHHGVDFAHYRFGGLNTIQGVIVQSITYGKVAASISDSYPFGNMVIIETPFRYLPVELIDTLLVKREDSLYTLYAHLENAPDVELGDQVSSCDQLGTVGRSGNAGIYHLHLETRSGKPGAQIPVMGYYLDDTTEEQKKYYEGWRTSGDFQLLDPMLILDPKWSIEPGATLTP